jgi:hypothetical protein
MHHKITETNQIETGIQPIDIATADRTSKYVNMANFGRIAALAFGKAIAIGKKITLQFFQAQDAAGTGKKAITGFAAVEQISTGSPTEDLELTDEIRAEDLDEGFPFVAAEVTCDDTSSNLGGVTLIRSDARFSPVSGDA